MYSKQDIKCMRDKYLEYNHLQINLRFFMHGWNPNIKMVFVSGAEQFKTEHGDNNFERVNKIKTHSALLIICDYFNNLSQ